MAAKQCALIIIIITRAGNFSTNKLLHGSCMYVLVEYMYIHVHVVMSNMTLPFSPGVYVCLNTQPMQ